MAWLTREKAPLSRGERLNPPEGLWLRCQECNEIIFKKDFENNQNVCPKCGHHYPISPELRIKHLLDQGSFEQINGHLQSADPLHFVDSKPYRQRLEKLQGQKNCHDAILTGRGLLHGRSVYLGVFDFKFMGGSMGSVVGEKISRLFHAAAEHRTPAIMVSSSGGARMQEGILSLMQMSKTCAALSKLKEQGIPFVSVLSHPTTGGVAASYAMLGDVNIGEPGALIGFAGPRVIQQTIREKLPDGFQRAEYLLEHGMLDRLCHRDALRDTIHQILSILLPHTTNS